MAIIPLVYSEPLLQAGYKEYISWDTDSAPHCAICGVTGTGKTYLTKLLCAKVSKHITDSHLTICDYKGDTDYNYLSGCERFYRFNECMEGLKDMHNTFLDMQKAGCSNGFFMLVFEEWGAFVNSLEKKEAEHAKKMLGNLLMLGRSYNLHVCLSQQKMYAEDYGKCRDQLNMVCLLGNASKEVVGMLFHDYKDFIKNDRQRGTGYILINGGTDFQPFVVPKVASMENVNNAIKEAVMR